MTRIARGKINLRRRRLDVAQVVRTTIEDHRPSFEAARIRLETVFAPGAFWMDADGDRLVQAVSNVLGNAEKYTPAGGTVSVHMARLDGEIDLRVRDTGLGIARPVLAHVFEPVAQGPQTSERGRGGLGLGLAMVKGFVELHGGRVTIASAGPGQGTEVRMVLPLSDGAGGRRHGAATRRRAPGA